MSEVALGCSLWCERVCTNVEVRPICRWWHAKGSLTQITLPTNCIFTSSKWLVMTPRTTTSLQFCRFNFNFLFLYVNICQENIRIRKKKLKKKERKSYANDEDDSLGVQVFVGVKGVFIFHGFWWDGEFIISWTVKYCLNLRGLN